MRISVGYVLCSFAKANGLTRLYTASRHSLRSGRPELFLM